MQWKVNVFKISPSMQFKFDSVAWNWSGNAETLTQLAPSNLAETHFHYLLNMSLHRHFHVLCSSMIFRRKFYQLKWSIYVFSVWCDICEHFPELKCHFHRFNRRHLPNRKSVQLTFPFQVKSKFFVEPSIQSGCLHTTRTRMLQFLSNDYWPFI